MARNDNKNVLNRARYETIGPIDPFRFRAASKPVPMSALLLQTGMLHQTFVVASINVHGKYVRSAHLYIQEQEDRNIVLLFHHAGPDGRHQAEQGAEIRGISHVNTLKVVSLLLGGLNECSIERRHWRVL
jgi:hypothetical protein